MDIFALESVALGELHHVILEHDNSGAASAWFVKRVSVRDSINNRKVYFHVNQWLASDRNNAKVHAADKLNHVASNCCDL
jgi:hypothetical protein